MESVQAWLYIIGALLVALFANSISAIWAGKDEKFSLWLLLLIVVSPLVFITFGLVASKIGVAMGSATIDALLTVSTIVVGLIFFQEWSKISIYQYFGISLVVFGILMMQFPFKSGA